MLKATIALSSKFQALGHSCTTFQVYIYILPSIYNSDRIYESYHVGIPTFDPSFRLRFNL